MAINKSNQGITSKHFKANTNGALTGLPLVEGMPNYCNSQERYKNQAQKLTIRNVESI